MKSTCKNFDVFDFNIEEEPEYPPSCKTHNLKLVNMGSLDTEKMSRLKGDLLFDISRHEHHQLSTEATAVMNEQLDFPIPESKSSDEADDVFADADESPRESSTSTSSCIPGDDGNYDEPLEGYEPSHDGCFGIVQKMGDRDVTLICPDYIVYQGRYSTESLLIFSKESMELKDSTTHGDQRISTFEWGIEDIVDIQTQWSKRLEIAMVKLHVLPKDAKDYLVEELQFAVADTNWPEKQEDIMSLNVRYKAVWSVVVDTETGRDEQASPRAVGESICRKSYFPNFVEFDEVVYPKGDPDAVSISKRDVDLLQPDIFVNDTIIDFYIKYLKNQMPVEKRNRFHFFNSFFFRKLIDLDKDPSSSFEGKAAFQRVRKWTRKVNLFEKDYVFIPVNYSYHWSLIVICHPGEVTKFQDEDLEKLRKVPCILHMDSMKGSHTVLKDVVQSYLWEEWKEKNKDMQDDISSNFFNLRFVSLELPQQPNAYDCGLFLLHYVERFLEEAPINFSPSEITHYSKFLNLDWFPPEEPCLKRAEIERLICDILEGKNSPAACGSNACDLDYPANNIIFNNNNTVESNLESISKRFSPKSAHGNLSGSQSSERIEITLLQTAASENGGDPSLVLRQFLGAGDTSGPYPDGQYQTFDELSAFGEMGLMQNDIEACGELVYTRPNINTESDLYLSNELRLDSHDAEGNFEENSIGGSGYSSEVEIHENNSSEKAHIKEEKIDEPRASSAENIISVPSQMLDVVEFEGDYILNSQGSADNDQNTFKLLEFTSHQNCNVEVNGNVASADTDVVQETKASEIKERQDSEILVSETNGILVLETIGDDYVAETDGKFAAKRNAEVLLPESNEQQPVKRLCLESGEEEITREDHGS